MLFHSTRGKDKNKTFEEVLMQGLANDGGLFMPDNWPQVDLEEIKKSESFIDIAKYIVPMFTNSSFTDGKPKLDKGKKEKERKKTEKKEKEKPKKTESTIQNDERNKNRKNIENRKAEAQKQTKEKKKRETEQSERREKKKANRTKKLTKKRRS